MPYYTEEDLRRAARGEKVDGEPHLVAPDGTTTPLRDWTSAFGPSESGPTHAGIAVIARDTGRVLLQQRSWDETDDEDVRGTWEFPSGGLECRSCGAALAVEGSTTEEAAARAVGLDLDGRVGVEVAAGAAVLPGIHSSGADSEEDVVPARSRRQVVEAQARAVLARSHADGRVTGVMSHQGADVSVNGDVQPAVQVADFAVDGGPGVAGGASGSVVQEAAVAYDNAVSDAGGEQIEGVDGVHAASVPPGLSQDHQHDWETPEEGAWREFSEETGLPKPEGEVVGGWVSDDGVYQCFLYAVETERDAFPELNPDLDAADTINPDDPDRANPDVTAWFTVEQIQGLGPALRPEVREQTDWSLFDLEAPMDDNEIAASLVASAMAQPSARVREALKNSPLAEDAQGSGRPWFGVLAPEGVRSGDKRGFTPDALRMRSLPLPLTWQKISGPGHDGNVVTAIIQEVWRSKGLIWGAGEYLDTPEADEHYNLVEKFGRYGVSIDADDLDEFAIEVDESDGTTWFTDARVCSTCAVSIPAFAEAFMMNGRYEEFAKDFAGGWGAPSQPIPTREGEGQDECEERDEDGNCIEREPDAERRESAQVDGTFAGTDSGVTIEDEEEGEPCDPENDPECVADEDHLPEKEKPVEAAERPGIGGYPINDCASLKDAIQAIGRAKPEDRERTIAHIRTQKKRLGCPEVELPDTWASMDSPEPVVARIAVAGPQDQIDAFIGLTQIIEHLGGIGASRTVSLDLDGDGALALRFDYGDLEVGEMPDISEAVDNGTEIPYGIVFSAECDDCVKDIPFEQWNGKSVLTASAGYATVQMKDLAPGLTEDGPGWLTHPVDTDRLRDYWVRGPGAAQIAWGTPDDFYRCRAAVAEYVKPQYINGYCANRHFDALGYWPGQAPHKGEAIAMTSTINGVQVSGRASLTASAPMKNPPREWFEDPGLPGPTPLTVTKEGRVFGHLAQWGQCHVGISGECVMLPKSATDYSYFHLGVIETDNGEVFTGPLVLGGKHAPDRLDWRAATKHYDTTSSVFADIRVGHDDHGVWMSGAIREGVTEEQIREAKASGKVSGDWREVVRGSRQLELICGLVIGGAGGFPVPRTRIGVEQGRVVSLVAAGVVERDDDPVDELVEEVASRLEQRQQVKAAAESLRSKVVAPRLASLRERVREE